MKHIFYFLSGLFFLGTAHAQSTLYVDGKELRTGSGDAVTLRGINAGIAEDGNINLSDAAACYAYIDQIALTGANSIRFTWYTDGVSWRDGGQYVQGDPNPEARYHKGSGTVMKDYLEDGHLGNIFAYCRSKNIIPILAIHDLTCSNDWNYFNNDLADWWTRPSVVAFIQAHESYMMINIANEMGHVSYAGGGAGTYTTFKNNYNALISDLRTAGVKVPIMIDAPDCGQSSSELLSMADEMQTADPLHNLVFSAHGYWSVYAPTQVAIEAKLDVAAATNVCFIMGEVANTQAGPPSYCGEIDISAIYPHILNGACARNIGWLAWTWDQDCDATREISTNGQFSSLTPWGNDVVNNSSYGLKSAGCGAVAPLLGIDEEAVSFAVYPNPANDYLSVYMEDNGKANTIRLTDLSGREVRSVTFSGTSFTIPVHDLPAGIYVLSVNRTTTKKIVITN